MEHCGSPLPPLGARVGVPTEANWGEEPSGDGGGKTKRLTASHPVSHHGQRPPLSGPTHVPIVAASSVQIWSSSHIRIRRPQLQRSCPFPDGFLLHATSYATRVPWALGVSGIRVSGDLTNHRSKLCQGPEIKPQLPSYEGTTIATELASFQQALTLHPVQYHRGPEGLSTLRLPCLR
ncbi:hypothetical protein NDU88_003323 [Pleurodeles waltl]|uniref:Uncharacterized protein n=1 Tax=Pleurodeles waltl TaxID=8319 RepID=A0AAV7WUH6_PLEWA|nr:hypothetical protein NDU88_003323 [Pleurodeles waltl]